MTRAVFYVSDSTAITAKGLGQSLLSQFKELKTKEFLRPYVNTKEKVQSLVAEIKKTAKADNKAPVIFASMMNEELILLLSAEINGVINILAPFITSLEEMLKEKSSKQVGQAHGAKDDDSYRKRIAAIEYALATDDGLKMPDYKDADIILLGVSRTGKTPTALYLALNFGLKVANFPFTSEDLPHFHLGEHHKKNRDKLFGLIISAERLSSIRRERRAGGDYANYLNVTLEINAMQELLTKEKIPFVDTTTRSVEEIAATIVGIKRMGG